MTEAEWLEGTALGPLLFSVSNKGYARKLRLFAAACCRRVPHLLTDARCRATVDAAERYADWLVSRRDFGHVQSRAKEANDPLTGDPSFGACVSQPMASRAAEMTAAKANADGTESAAHLALFRDIFGNPFRQVVFAPEWLTDTVRALAAQMYESRDFSPMPILADALQDAGCDSEVILSHCREEGTLHARGCWVCDLVLGKS